MDLLGVTVRYRRRRAGGWAIVNVANSRELGWVTRNQRGGWDLHVAAAPFRGDERTDGHLLDYVPPVLYGGDDDNHHPPIGRNYGSRDHAAIALIYHLDDRQAPGLGRGYGPHRLVKRYEDD